MKADINITTFIEEAHRFGREGLQLCSSGNLSYRISADQALVSGTGCWLGKIRMEDIALCRISDRAHLEGVKPSMESSFHLGIMNLRPEVKVVLHFQSEYATALACMKNIPSNFNVTAEIPSHLGREIPIIPYCRPGSPELAAKVTFALSDHDAALLVNHGQVVCGTGFDDVFQKAMFFEMACRIIVQAGVDNYNVLSESEIDDLLEYISGKQA